MKSFKLFWNVHKWCGIAASAIFALTAVTGFMLLVKKKVDWIQPATMRGESGDVADFISVAEAYDVVLAQAHADFAVADDVDRIDMRPGKRVYKVRSKQGNTEIQVCAVTGAVLSVATRRSDFIETLHDGSFFGDTIHTWVMPAASVVLLFMVFSGLWLWLEPKVRRRRRLRRARERLEAEAGPGAGAGAG